MRPEKKLEILDTIDHCVEALKNLKEAVNDEEPKAMSEHYNDLNPAYESLQFLLSD